MRSIWCRRAGKGPAGRGAPTDSRAVCGQTHGQSRALGAPVGGLPSPLLPRLPPAPFKHRANGSATWRHFGPSFPTSITDERLISLNHKVLLHRGKKAVQQHRSGPLPGAAGGGLSDCAPGHPTGLQAPSLGFWKEASVTVLPAALLAVDMWTCLHSQERQPL